MKVICIRNSDAAKAGDTGTVSWIGVVDEWQADENCGRVFDLAERPSPATRTHHRGYLASHWRLAVERKTDISIFQKMITPEQPMTSQQEADLLLAEHQAERRQFERDLEVIRKVLERKL